VKFIDGVCSNQPVCADGQELGTTDEECVEAWDASARDGARIGVVDAVIVDEIVCGELSEAVGVPGSFCTS
jgi:hypothetical protein